MKAYFNIGESSIQIVQTEPYLATVVDFYVDPEERRHHVGRRLMIVTCRDADRENVTLDLSPMPFSTYDIETETSYPPGLTYKQLCAFYRSFGFRFRPKPIENTMRRKPKDI